MVEYAIHIKPAQVSQWMDNGSAIEHVKTQPHVNRLKLLEGVVLVKIRLSH
jgi:hypothetical protein